MTTRRGYADMAAVLADQGLQARGGFYPEASDLVPSLADSETRTVVLVGNAGRRMWQVFSHSAEYRDGRADPLDRWIRQVLSQIASDRQAVVVFPFSGPPYYPFQRWAMRAEAVYPSPIGALIHPKFGLWHAYRGALLFPQRLVLPPRADPPSPCADCADKPCLGGCPVNAFTAAHYAVPVCRAYLRSDAGEDCIQRACAARRACPIGREYHYSNAQAELHMRAFLRPK